MKISEVIRITDEICPPELAEEWDNCGWQIKCWDGDVMGVLTALEITGAVIDEAVSGGVNLIITHHPMIFQGIKSVDVNTVLGNYIIRLINNGISVYSCHTDFDKAEGGNNDHIGEALELTDVRCLDDGFTRIGKITGDMTASEFAVFVCRKLNLDERSVRICGDPHKHVKKAGWCSGAGADFAEAAAKAGCDVFVTGDVRYHEAREAAEAGRIVIIDAGHFGTEVSFGENMAGKLSERLGAGVKVFSSAAEKEPFAYL